MTDSPRASTAADVVVSGSPARRARGAAADSPESRRAASVEVTQRPSLVMPMGVISYFLGSMALRTDAAESSETSCSPLRPPKRTPTRSFLAIAPEHNASRATCATVPECLGWNYRREGNADNLWKIQGQLH